MNRDPIQFDSENKAFTLKEKMRAFKMSLRHSASPSKKPIVSGILVIALAISTVFLTQRVQTPVPVAENSQAAVPVPWTYPRKLKVIILRYFNPSSPEAFRSPANAQILTDNMQGILFQSSKFKGNPIATSSVQVEVAGTYDFNGLPPNPTGEWEDGYRQMVEQILPGENRTVCDRINAEGIDQVWFMGDPSQPGFIKGPEFAISSKYIRPETLALNYEYQILPKTLFCGGQKSFMVFYFDLSRVEVSSHAMGHYMESLLGAAQGFELFTKGYMGVSYYGNGVDGEAIPGVNLSDKCGSIHVPPNVSTILSTNPNRYKGYEYGDPTEVQSSCDNWKPDGSGAKSAVSAATWTNSNNLIGSQELRYHTWWMRNLPNMNNGLTYNQIPLPNWWDFMVDTDETIAFYLNNTYYMNPDLFFAVNTSACASTTNDTYITCSFNPSGVLGAATESTEKDSELSPAVLQSSAAEYGKMILVTVGYSPSAANASAAVEVASYCGLPLTKVNATPSSGGGMKTEMFYIINPVGTNCQAYLQFTRAPGERIVSVSEFNNVATTGTVSTGTTITGSTSTTYTINPTFVSLNLTSTKDTLPLCTYAQYSEQTTPPNTNAVTTTGKTRQLWKYEHTRVLGPNGEPNPNGPIANVWGGLVGGTQRTADGMQTVTWTFGKTMPWSATCANFKVKPFTTPPTTPPVTPPPPTPAPIPSVTLKVNGADNVTIPYNKSVSLSWTSSNVTSCTASNGWTGTKAVSGFETTALLTANKTYTINCTGSFGSVSDTVNVTVTRVPVVDLKINGSDTSVTLEKGIAPTLAWTQTGATSCTASGGWTGTKAVAGGYEKGAVLGNNATYTLTCTNASGSASDTVSVVAAATTAKTGYLAQYFSDTNFQKLGSQSVISSINFDWGTTGLPYPGGPSNYYSSRYTAQITPSVTGTYTFITTSDDGVRLYVDDVPVIYDWIYHGRAISTGTIALTAGKQYDFVLEHAESTGGATMIFQAGIGTSPAALNPKAVALNLGNNGGGLTAEYFGTDSFTNVIATTREPLLDSLWTTVPTSQLPRTYNSARYSGTITPKVSATYTFAIPQGVRMWINNVEKTASPTQAMTANTAYNIRFETKLGEYMYFYARWKYGTQPYTALDFRFLRPLVTTQTQQPSPPVSAPSRQGITGTYFDKRDFTGNSVSRIDPYIQFYWSGAVPIETIPTKDFSVRWTGSLVVPTAGAYTFYTEADDGIRVFVDGQKVIDKWTWESHSGNEQSSNAINLSAGDHSLVVEYNQGSGGSKAILRWSGPNITKRVIQTENLKAENALVSGVRASYFNNESFSGTSIDKTDPSINFTWNTDAPTTGVNANNFSVRWTGVVNVTDQGSYTFYTEADDGMKIWIDDQLVLDYWWWQSHYGAEKASNAITLSPGTHTVKVEAHDASGGSKAILRWSGPNIPKQVVPLYLN